MSRCDVSHSRGCRRRRIRAPRPPRICGRPDRKEDMTLRPWRSDGHRCFSDNQSLGRPVRCLESSEISKEDVARQLLAEHPNECGLICTLTAVEPCVSFEYQCSTDSAMRGLLRVFIAAIGSQCPSSGVMLCGSPFQSLRAIVKRSRRWARGIRRLPRRATTANRRG